MQADLTSQPRRVHEACSSTCCCEMSSEEAGRAFASVLMENLFNNERVSDELCNQGFTAFRLPSRHEGSKSVLSSSNHYVDKDSTIENENLKCQECYSGGARIAEELEHLYMKHTGDCGAKEELMQRNATQFGNGLIFHKPFIHEYDLHDSRSKSLQPTAYHCLDESRKWIANSASKDNVSSSDLHQQLGLGSDNHDAVSIKLQYNEGHGGCFPIHYDNPGGSSKRALTVLCYLNRSWFSDTNDSLGGEIVLLPFLSRNCYAFAPVMGLVVAFRSDIILHYTRPSQNRRLLMTIWIDGSRINLKEDMQITVKPNDCPDAEAQRLFMSPAQRLISRAFYEEIYERTLIDCLMNQVNDMSLRDNMTIEDLVNIHRLQVKAARQQKALARLVDRLREHFKDRLIPQMAYYNVTC